MASLFFSYSHADEGMRDQLEKHLSGLKNQGIIEAWHDRRIQAGQHLELEIDSHLESANIILLLVSPDFLSSKYCYQKEMQRAMELASSGAAVVIPVILRPCDWQDAPFGKLLATPKDGRPITLWANLDEAFLEVVKAIKSVLPKPQEMPCDSGKRQTVTATSTSIRSSNLRIAKQFNELERDRFLHEGFEFLTKFFENSLDELRNRNPGIETTFKLIDATRFTAAVYRNGEKKCKCSIFLGRMPDGISYSMSDDPHLHSLNENLSVDADDQALYFRPLGMQSFGRSRDKLSLQGAAEFYWELFIRPLQQ